MKRYVIVFCVAMLVSLLMWMFSFTFWFRDAVFSGFSWGVVAMIVLGVTDVIAWWKGRQ